MLYRQEFCSVFYHGHPGNFKHHGYTTDFIDFCSFYASNGVCTDRWFDQYFQGRKVPVSKRTPRHTEVLPNKMKIQLNSQVVQHPRLACASQRQSSTTATLTLSDGLNDERIRWFYNRRPKGVYYKIIVHCQLSIANCTYLFALIFRVRVGNIAESKT